MRRDRPDKMTTNNNTQDRCDKLEKALGDLLDKLDAIKPHVDNVCVIANMHGFPYGGPNWATEYDAARLLVPQRQ